MSASPRTNKPRKGPETGVAGRGRGAWRGGGPGAGSGFPAPGRQFGPNAFPPLAHGPAHQFMLATLVGTPVLLTTRANQRLEGVLGAAANEDGTPGAVLRNARDVANTAAPIQEQMFIPAQNIAGCVPAAGSTAFRTDADIAGANPNGPRPPWSSPPPPASAPGQNVDELTFGASASSGQPWDQFQANEKMFGVVTSFNEEAYTTALDRNAPDFKEKERKAEIIAKEIMAGSTNNPHLAEERGAVDDSGMNEEDKYSSVVRGQNAYIPPGARRAAQANGSSSPSPAPTAAKSPPVPVAAKSPPPSNTNNVAPAQTPAGALATNAPAATTPAATTDPKPDVPKLAINGTEAATGAQAKAGENNLVGSFREFVTNEKQRLAQKKQAIVKSEKEKRMAELVAFSQTFKLNKPIPKDLVPILTKDSEKAKAIVEKTSADAASARARNIGGATATINANAHPTGATNASVLPAGSGAGAMKKTATTTGATKVPKMVIQAIPPFNPNKLRGAAGATPAAPKKDGVAAGKDGANLSVKTGLPPAKKDDREPSPTSAAFRLNVNASSFRPGHGSSASVSAGATPSPKTKAAAPDAVAAPPNPFYGTKTFKKTQMTMLKEEFNPFKFAKVADSSSVPPNWPYTGRKFMLLFSAPVVAPQPQPPAPQPAPQPQPQQPPPPQPQQPPPPGPHPGHPPPPPMQQQTPPVPGPYEEDHGRSPYMQMYPYGYPYPGQPPMQPMMQVPPTSAPPGYMQGPYMQPMPYPQHQMPPNQPMYGAPMPGIPHIAYMPPPPGAYPPGAAPRGSMPPPHGYYHQSPQLGHAVPYPMMMQGPPGAPTPHPYDPNGPPNGPPGPLGVGH
ncbi:protein phosphatase 1 regulatory subunit 7 [Ceratobasidium sp. AG-Ba]|nr:protein phosphatase 1 regulatory subunit 7 [Ceratobasidium sp. AG-Ba]